MAFVNDPDETGIFDEATMTATVLRVRSVENSVAWYRDKLGLEPLYVGEDGPDHPIASFMIADAVVSLWQLAAGEASAPADSSTSYVAVVMNSDLHPIRRSLAERGVEVSEVRQSTRNDFVWFYDLDGNRFELARPR
jgi:catechol 2,3-dioxygenase-like lactoylglutathione lyase family enzyme